MTDDPELLSAWKAGDRAAGQTLVTRHYPAIVRFFETKAWTEADDLAQRTFLRCQEGTWSATGSVRAWLYGIARNVLFEHFRAAVRDGRDSPDFHSRSIADLQPGVATQAARRDDQRLLLRALQTLPVESQLLLELFYWEELPIPDLATVLGVAEGTIKSRLHRARGHLREALDRLPADPTESASVRVLLAQWIAGLQDA
jgi:RNA polymerase sigma factor (sigma-70 family)